MWSPPKPTPAMLPTALKHQVKPIRVLREALDENDQALCVMAMGLGKTVVSAFVVEEYLNVGQRGLFLCHNNYILGQAEKEYRKVIGNHIKYSTFYGDENEKDWYADKAQMLFASFQSMNNHHAEWYKVFDPNHFDFLVVDESHHGQAVTYSPVIEYFNCKKLGLTGTPDREDGRDIRDLFGEEVVNIPLEVGIVNGWLTHIEYHILSDGINNRKLKKILARVLKGKERVSVKQLNETIFINARTNQQRLIMNEYSEIKSRSQGKKTMIFCENIDHAEHVAGFFDNAGVIHSRRPKGENQDALDQFRIGELQYLISVDKMNEGIDVPDVEVEAFLRATDSQRVWYQQTGRGARKAPGKEKLVVLDFVANIDRLLMIRELLDRIEKEVEQDEELKAKLSKRSFNVSGEGFEFIFSDDLVNLLEVIKVLRDGFYKTWEEASKAAIALGITQARDYKKKYKGDRRLPSGPNVVYENFPGWIVFLGGEAKQDPYPTWQEASVAAKRLGIRTSKMYWKMFSKDPKLPAKPQVYYSDFPSFPVFLRDTPKPVFYKTWQEASEAAKKLGLRVRGDYVEGGYKGDPKLPSVPHKYYSDFPGYSMFLRGKSKPNFYKTWQEASEAARAMGLISDKKYKKSQAYKKDPRLPSTPEEYYQNFPGKSMFYRGEAKKVFYPTWEQASRAARRLGIETFIEYKTAHRKDPALPSNPNVIYPDFPGYPTFLRKEPPIRDRYKTWQEASKAARRLGIKSVKDYYRLRKRDPRLPGNPQPYPDFPGWYMFLKGKARVIFYKTWEEAGEAARKLGIKIQVQYMKKRKKDPRLPSTPDKVYPDFPGYPTFLRGEPRRNFYKTWQEASRAAIKLKIKHRKHYVRDGGYKKDRRLHGSPHKFYPDFPGYPVFLGKTKKNKAKK